MLTAEKTAVAIDTRAEGNIRKLEDEEWRLVVGWKKYEVSNRGRVRRAVGGSGAKADRILKLAMAPYGYLRAFLSDRFGGRKLTPRPVHRLVYEAFVGLIPGDKQINHKDGDKANNDISNLEVVTAKENTAHAFATGLKRVHWAEESQGAKLTNAQVIEIRRLLVEGVPQTKIAEQFGVTQGTISHIYRGATWPTLSERAAEVARVRATRAPNGRSTKLSTEDVLRVRTMLREGVSQAKVAQHFGVSQALVCKINTGKVWNSTH